LKGKDCGVHAFLVPLRDPGTNQELPGVTIGDCGDKNGLHGVDNGFIIFDHVRIPRVNLLNRFSDVDEHGNFSSKFTSEDRRFGAMLGELTTGRSTIAVATILIRKLAVTIATRYAFQRRQFGPVKDEDVPIIQYSSHCVRLMPIIASCYAGDFATREMLKKFAHVKHSDNREEIAEVHALSAGLKSVYSWDTQRYLQIMRECCGGHGYSAYNRFGVLSNDHDITLTYEGDNTVLIQQVGAYLMKQFAKQFQGNVITDTLKFLRKKMGVYVKRRNFVVTRLASRKHLLQSEFHQQVFEYRTASLLQECVQVYNANKKKVGDFYSWEASVPTMVRLGRAFVEQFTLERLIAKINAIPDKDHNDLYKVMKLVADVYALSIIDRNIGDFTDVVKSNKSHAISRLLEELCVEMRQYALLLVDGFAFPDFIVDAPIGFSTDKYEDKIFEYALTKVPSNHRLNKESILNLGGKSV
jgi:acyl-CoA oxidase